MQIAKLNQRVELLQPILSSDGYGGYATNYKKVISLWAEVKDSRYSEKQAFDTPNALSNITLKTRTYIRMEKGWHLLWQGREYEIVAVTRFYKDSSYIEIAEYEKGV